MPIHYGRTEIPDVYLGAQRLAGVYVGSTSVWSTMQWLFYDDFERTTLGSDWVSTGGAVLTNGQLKKNTTAGSSDNWTAQTFPGDDLWVRATLGEVTDPVQVSSVSLGSPSQYVYVEFSTNGGQIGDYNGSVWTRRTNVPALAWAAGDRIDVVRAGTSVGVYRNLSLVAQASSSVALGAAYRRVNLSVRVHVQSGFLRYYSPTFDDVRIRVND